MGKGEKKESDVKERKKERKIRGNERLVIKERIS